MVGAEATADAAEDAGRGVRGGGSSDANVDEANAGRGEGRGRVSGVRSVFGEACVGTRATVETTGAVEIKLCDAVREGTGVR